MDYTILEQEKKCYEGIEQRYVLVIDTRRIGVFDASSKSILTIVDLDSLKCKRDLIDLRHSVIELMEN